MDAGSAGGRDGASHRRDLRPISIGPARRRPGGRRELSVPTHALRLPRLPAGSAAAVALAAALVAAALALLRSDEAAAGSPAQAITLTPRVASAFGATGLTGLARRLCTRHRSERHRRAARRPGCCASSAMPTHGPRSSAPSPPTTEAVPARLLQTVGGIRRSVAPGRSWEMTAELAAGRYVALDFGDSNQAARSESFRVARGGTRDRLRGPGRASSPSSTTRSHSTLPKHFSGRGVVEIPNLGSEWHEISLVRTPAGKTASDVLGPAARGRRGAARGLRGQRAAVGPRPRPDRVRALRPGARALRGAVPDRRSPRRTCSTPTSGWSAGSTSCRLRDRAGADVEVRSVR